MNGLKGICGLLLAAGMFASCEKEITLTNYSFFFNEENYTQPREIADPDIQAFYVRLREDFAALGANDIWQIDVTNRKYGPDDEKALARYNTTLAAIKECEAKYRTKIAELEKREGSSFQITYIYKLSRDIPADHFSEGYSPVILGEYSFDLRYD